MFGPENVSNNNQELKILMVQVIWQTIKEAITYNSEKRLKQETRIGQKFG